VADKDKTSMTPERPKDLSPTYTLFAERAWAYIDYLEAKLRRCRAETLRDAADKLSAPRWVLLVDEADGCMYEYDEVQNELRRMAEEAERE
jgi:hypothetical protein